MSDDIERAAILVRDIMKALALGTRHYNEAGKLLETPREIVETLLREGKITLEPRG